MSLIRVTGGRVRVDDTEPKVIKLSGQGPQGATGATGPAGVVAATAPVVYTSGTQTVSLTTDQASGVPVLDANGKIKTAQLPALAVSDTFVVSSQSAMLALSSAEAGDIAVRTDLSKSFILTATPASTLGNWQELLTPPDTVLSVNGQTGVVDLTPLDIGALDTAENLSDVQDFNAARANLSALGAADNLADLTNVSDARTNLGLGNSATRNIGTTTNTVTAGDDTRVTGAAQKSSNLSDLTSASTARTNLGLGSLATETNTQTVSGTAISSTNKIVDAASLNGAIDRPNAMILYPWFFWNSNNQFSFIPTADIARATRFTATRDFTVTKIAFFVLSAATNNDSVQVAILNSAGTTVHASSTAGTVGVNSTGLKTATLSSSYKLTRGTTYYVALAYDYTSGTGASIASGNAGTGSAQLFGNTIGTSDALLASGASSITGSTFSGTQSTPTIPFFVLFDN